MEKSKQQRRTDKKTARKQKNKARGLKNSPKLKPLKSKSKTKTDVYSVRSGHVVVVNDPEQEQVIFAVRPGQYGHKGGINYKVSHLDIVSMVDEADKSKDDGRPYLGALVNNLGLLTLSQLLKSNLAEGVDELPRLLAKVAGLPVPPRTHELDEKLAGLTTLLEESPALEAFNNAVDEHLDALTAVEPADTSVTDLIGVTGVGTEAAGG